MTEAPPFTPARPAAPVTTLDCVRCGYQLANPHPDGHCTECGAPIAASIGAPFDVAGQRRVRRGAWMLLLFVAIMLPKNVIWNIDPTLLPTWVTRPLGVALLGIELAGIWWLTSPPRINHRFDRFRRATRVLALIVIGPSIGGMVALILPRTLIRETWATGEGPLWLGLTIALLCFVALIVRQASARFNVRDLWIVAGSIMLGAFGMVVFALVAGLDTAPSMIVTSATGLLGALTPLLLALWIRGALAAEHSPLVRGKLAVALVFAVVFAMASAAVSILQIGLVIWAYHGDGWPPDWVFSMVVAVRYPRLAGLVLVPLLLALVVLRVIPRTESS